MRFSRSGVVLVLLLLWAAPARLSAQNAPSFTIDSFLATYNLDRDAHQVSVMSVEEALVAAFPLSGNNNFTGLTRSIPLNYLSHPVNFKLTSVTQTGGASIKYRDYRDKKGNEVIELGDPSIKVFGNQSYNLNYQTKDIINFKPDTEELLLNVNGRGWEVPFNSISAVVHLPDSLISSLSGAPTCYLGLGDKKTTECQAKIDKNQKGKFISISANRGLKPHEALVAQLEFKKGTFRSLHRSFINRHKKVLLPVVAIVGFLVISATIRSLREHRKKLST